MKNLISYEAINEAATALPDMPAFLKAAGAKPQHIQFGGPRNMGTQPPNAWVVSAGSPISGTKEIWNIVFFPNGTFHTTAGKAPGSFLKTTGKWKADAAENFTFGKLKIKGVEMILTSYMVLNPPS